MSRLVSDIIIMLVQRLSVIGIFLMSFVEKRYILLRRHCGALFIVGSAVSQRLT
jgi:hypothetical protein